MRRGSVRDEQTVSSCFIDLHLLYFNNDNSFNIPYRCYTANESNSQNELNFMVSYPLYK